MLLDAEDIQARMLAIMYQPVRIGDRTIGHVSEVRPCLSETGHYTGRFDITLWGPDPFMGAQTLENVHWSVVLHR